VRKSQIEMVGLLVIVILVVLVLFFVLSFSLSQPNDTGSRVQEFVDDSILNGFALVLLETSSGCGDYNFKELLEDNATQSFITCEVGDNDERISSGEFAEKNLERLVNRSMNFLEMDYEFTVTLGRPGGGEELMRIVKNGCENARRFETDSASFPTRQDYQPVHVRLKACW